MTHSRLWLGALALVASGMMLPQTTAAEDGGEIKLILEQNRFIPNVVKVKAKTPVVLVIENKDSAVEEFDSTALRVERLIPAGKTVRIRLPGLPAGTYEFIGEYHESTAQGRVVAE